MGEIKLSHALLDAGFFSALGTTERPGGNETLVVKGTRYTYENNNGIAVVYDEEGRPWVTCTSNDKWKAFFNERLRRGAYVPHSNDGGHFVRTVIPTL